MEKIRNRKLVLRTETVRRLSGADARRVAAGGTNYPLTILMPPTFSLKYEDLCLDGVSDSEAMQVCTCLVC